jgi:hypothetical protein
MKPAISNVIVRFNWWRYIYHSDGSYEDWMNECSFVDTTILLNGKRDGIDRMNPVKVRARYERATKCPSTNHLISLLVCYM